MNIIRVFLLVCVIAFTGQSHSMLIPKSAYPQDRTPRRHPSLKKLKEQYSCHEGVIWDSEELYVAQERGYEPVKVKVYDAFGNVAERKIYHGMHVKAVELPQLANKYAIRIPDKDFCKDVSHLMHRRSIAHPVILGSQNGSSAGRRFSAGNYTLYINEKSKAVLFELGHELAHCKLHEVMRNPSLTLNEKEEIRESLLKSDSYIKAYVYLQSSNFQHLEEFYCDKEAANILADSTSAKRFLIEQGIKRFHKSIEMYGDEASDTHPKKLYRIVYLQRQLNVLDRDSE